MGTRPKIKQSQTQRAVALLHERGMLRLAELRKNGVTAATLSRLERRGEVARLARGLYQLTDAPLHSQHALAEASKLVPKGVVCLISALAFYDLTDQVPRQVWMAIGPKDWRPKVSHPPMKFVRFPRERLTRSVEYHKIEDVRVPIFGVAKTLADLFRYRRLVGTGSVIDGIREALRKKKVTPADVSKEADEAGVWKRMQPYLEALT
jgi:predicted transcriptional regulator of viral defense system